MSWLKRDRKIYIDIEQGKEAEEAVRQAEARWPVITHAVEVVAQLGRDNHFRQRFEAEFEKQHRHGGKP